MSDIDIAQRASKLRIEELAHSQFGIASEHLDPYGHYKAKLSLDYVDSLSGNPDGKLILVTAISPTPAGEGKTTTSVGLGDGLNRIGKKNDRLPARTFAWSLLRNEGRGRLAGAMLRSYRWKTLTCTLPAIFMLSARRTTYYRHLSTITSITATH